MTGLMTPTTHRYFCLLGCCLSLAGGVSAASGRESETFGQDPDVQAAAEKILRFLAGRQTPDGCFPTRGTVKSTGPSATAVMAFLAHGNVPGRGKYGEVVRKGVDFLLNSASPSGLIYRDQYRSNDPMYCHALATLALAEVWGMTGSEKVRMALRKAIDLLVRTQNREGGWRYRPIPHDADLSATVMVIVALRGARDAGMDVPSITIDNAVKYVTKCHDEKSGGFRYQPGRQASWSQSAAGAMSMIGLGLHERKEIKPALEFIIDKASDPKGTHNWFYYGHYYSAVAMYQAGDEYWKRWWPAAKKQILEKVESGEALRREPMIYHASCAALVLGIPYRFLPIYQR